MLGLVDGVGDVCCLRGWITEEQKATGVRRWGASRHSIDASLLRL